MENRYDFRAPFNDNLSHFLRMNKGDVEEYFKTGGVVDREPGLPNWVARRSNDSYELIRLNGEEEESAFGLAFTIKPKIVAQYSGEGGKAVATWNYSVSVPSEREESAYQLYSDDTLKYIFAYPGALIAAIPPRMRQMQHQLSTLRMRNQHGDIPLMPYVNLAFFMWMEDNQDGASKQTIDWLVSHMEGWDAAFS